MTVTFLPKGHSELTRVIRYWGDQNTTQTYLNLMDALLSELDLPNGDPRLVTNSGGPKSTYILPITLGMRYLLAFHRRKEMAFLILPRSYEIGHPLFEFVGHFSPLAGENDIPPAYGLTRSLQTLVENEQVLSDWKAAARAEVNRQRQSSFRRYHKPAVYEAARNPDYREMVFDQSFND